MSEDILSFCADMRHTQAASPAFLSPMTVHHALTRMLRHLYAMDRGGVFDRWDRRFVVAAYDALYKPRMWEQDMLRLGGVGTLIIERDGGSWCPGCHGGWPSDLSRVGERCGNLMCPDRIVGVSPAGGVS